MSVSGRPVAVIEPYAHALDVVGGQGWDWHWYCLVGACLEDSEQNSNNSSIGGLLPTQQMALRALEFHQIWFHPCPDCNGEGAVWSWSPDGVSTYKGVCDLCGSTGVDLRSGGCAV